MKTIAACIKWLPVKLFLFWLLFFAFYRFSFICVNYPQIIESGYAHAAYAYVAGLPLDLSAIGYLLCFGFLIQLIANLLSRPLTNLLIIPYAFILALCSIICFGNFLLYPHWHTLLGYRAVLFLGNPAEVASFVSVPLLVVSILLFVMFYGGWFIILRNFVSRSIILFNNKKISIPFFITVPLLLFLMIRGGLQVIPINESAAVYSPVQINNHSAINPAWYFIRSMLNGVSKKNSFHFFTDEEAANYLKPIYLATDSTTKIITQTKPNIVVILLESWTADLSSHTNNKASSIPFFDSIANHGILFSNAYSSGFRTDQGLTSVYSGWPALPDRSIIFEPDKAERLPSLFTTLSKNGYASSFVYGGEIDFANMKNYLLSHGAKKIIDRSDYESTELTTKWGAHDEFIFNKQAALLSTEPQPFFNSVLTLSTHEPFDVPGADKAGATTHENFKEAARYTDKCLRNYFEKIKHASWFDNTLFILVADHGHELPENRDMNYPESHRICCLFYGNVISERYRGMKIKKVIAQHDLATTLLNQLNINSETYTWSRDVFSSSYVPFAYYSNENSVGTITNKKADVFFFNQPNPNGTSDTIGKAMVQLLYKDYMNLK
ncbi:MAG: LTA synthase family protein [Bacteroidetes bacterium]|nr:LTA synthase family protein [Bacteroidota bacterium]